MILSWALAFVLGIFTVENFHLGLSFSEHVLMLLIVVTAFVVLSWLFMHPKRDLIGGQSFKRRAQHLSRITVFIWLSMFMFGLVWAFVYERFMTPSLNSTFFLSDDSSDSSDGRPFIGYGKILSTPDVDGQYVKLIIQIEGVYWNVRQEKDEHDRWIVPLPREYAMVRQQPDRWSELILDIQSERPLLQPRTIWMRLKLDSAEEKVLAKKMIAGDKLLFTGFLQPRSMFQPMTPGAFDFSRYLWEEGIEYAASGQFAHVIIIKRGPFWNAWKASFMDRVRAAYEDAPESVRALALAIVFGDKREVSGEMRDAFQHAGVYHLLIVSGMHFAILTVALYALFGFLSVAPNQRNMLILTFIIGYAWLASGSVAVERAAWMGGIYGIGKQLKLRFSPWIAFSIPLIVSLLFNPRQLLTIGFLMTFVLTAGLMRYTASLTQLTIQFIDAISRKMHHPVCLKILKGLQRPRVASFLAMLVLTELLSMIFLLAYFHVWPSLSPVANALLLPFYTMILPIVAALSFIGGLIAWIDDALAQWTILPAAYALWLIEKAVMMFAELGRFLRITFLGSGRLWAIATMSTFFIMLEMVYRRFRWQSLLPLYPGPRWLDDMIAFRKPLRSVAVIFLMLAVLYVPVGLRSYAGVQKAGVFFMPTASVRLVGILFPGKQAVFIVEEAPLEQPSEPWRRTRNATSDMQKVVIPTLGALGVTQIKALIVPETILDVASPAALRKYSPIASLCRMMDVEKIYIIPSVDRIGLERADGAVRFSVRHREALQALCPSSPSALWVPNTAHVHDRYQLTLTFPEPQAPWLKRVPVWTLHSEVVFATFRAGGATIQRVDGKKLYIDYRPRYEDGPAWFLAGRPQNVYTVAQKGFIWIDLLTIK